MLKTLIGQTPANFEKLPIVGHGFVDSARFSLAPPVVLPILASIVVRNMSPKDSRMT